MISFLAALILTAQAPTSTPALPAPNKVVVTVNGHPILAKEVEAYLWEWNAPQVGQLLTVLELLRQEAAKENVTVTPEEVQQKVNIQVEQLMAGAPKGAKTSDVLMARNMSPSRLNLMVRGQLTLEKLAAKQFKPTEFVRIATIIVHPKSAAAADQQEALTKVGAAYSALKKGDSWDTVLKAYATEPQSIQSNGELGWRSEDQFPAATRMELDTMKLNGFTKPIQTPTGYQIFRLETRGKDASPGELAEAKVQFVSQEERAIVQHLQQGAKIVNSY
jgi:hypothetical protein